MRQQLLAKHRPRARSSNSQIALRFDQTRWSNLPRRLRLCHR
jgi:hypothetical protein